MRNSYSPSALKTLDDLCPKALDFYQERSPWLTDLFDVGTAAHAFLEGLALATFDKKAELTTDETGAVLQAVAAALIAGSWRGQNHPIAPSDVWEARDLALAWVEREPMDPEAKPEIGAAFDRHWNKVDWSSRDRRFRLVFDMVRLYEDGDEETTFDVAEATDFKTSWATSAVDLESWQMKAQLFCLSLMFPKAEVYRVRLVNLRTLQTFTAERPNDPAELASIRADIETAMAAADEERKARVGAHCIKCPHVTRCEAAQAALAKNNLTDDIGALAESYIVAKSIAKKLEPMLRAAAQEVGKIELPGGFVGFVESTSLDVTPEQSKALCDEWANRGGDLQGLLACIDGLSGTQVKAVAKRLYSGRKEKAEREAFVEQFTTTVKKPRFTVKTTKGDDE